MVAYYNENDPYAAQWIKNLAAAGLIAAGDIDDRSIRDVTAADLAGYDQCHFFAGIGGWSYALRLADWPDDRPAWTGSCPCQPFSTAGKQKGTADERHLWPEFRSLIAECRPAIVFGEQVASKAGRLWLSGVRADLEALGYVVGAADLCAAGIGAPHIRQRLFWVADTEHAIWRAQCGDRQDVGDRCHCGRKKAYGQSGACRKICRLADTDEHAVEQGSQIGTGRSDRGAAVEWPGFGGSSGTGRLGDPGASRLSPSEFETLRTTGWRGEGRATTEPSSPHSFWRDAEWLQCLDGKARRAQPGIFPLAHGVSGRVGRLRGYGNAIVPQVAAEFVIAFCECAP